MGEIGGQVLVNGSGHGDEADVLVHDIYSCKKGDLPVGDIGGVGHQGPAGGCSVERKEGGAASDDRNSGEWEPDVPYEQAVVCWKNTWP